MVSPQLGRKCFIKYRTCLLYTSQYFNGSARPFKNAASHDKIPDSSYYGVPYTKKQLKAFEYIGKYAEYFEELFESAQIIIPEEKYDGVIKQTFGPESKVYQLYHEKAIEPTAPKFQPTLYIDFEAMNMRICGWYAELVGENDTQVYEGIEMCIRDRVSVDNCVVVIECSAQPEKALCSAIK